VVDVLRRWTPYKGQKLNPKLVLAEIAELMRTYRIYVVYSDQYQLESLQQIMLDMGLSIEGIDFTQKSKVKVYGNLLQLVNQQKLTLLDADLSLPAKVAVQELVQLERRTTHGGGLQISAPDGKHDDMCSVIALAAFKSVWMPPVFVGGSAPKKEPTVFELCQKTIKGRMAAESEW
jgi:hypothetical protein